MPRERQCPACNNRVSRDRERHVIRGWTDVTGQKHTDRFHIGCGEIVQERFIAYKKISRDIRARKREEEEMMKIMEQEKRKRKKKRRQKKIQSIATARVDAMEEFVDHGDALSERLRLRTRLRELGNMYCTESTKMLHVIGGDHSVANYGSGYGSDGEYDYAFPTCHRVFGDVHDLSGWRSKCEERLERMHALIKEKIEVETELAVCENIISRREIVYNRTVKEVEAEQKAKRKEKRAEKKDKEEQGEEVIECTVDVCEE